MTRSSKICLWNTPVLVMSKMCYHTLQHPITCQNNFLSDCHITIVFKNNRGKTACILVLLKKFITNEGCHINFCIWLKCIWGHNSTSECWSSDLLCQTSNNLTSFSMTISFFSSHISHQFPHFCVQMLIHSSSLWSTFWEGKKTIPLMVILHCDDVLYNET